MRHVSSEMNAFRNGECLMRIIPVEATDHAGMAFILDSARPRVRTAREHWPRLLEAAVLVSQDPVFVASGEPLHDRLRRDESAHSFAG
jgi:hypothetical protein